MKRNIIVTLAIGFMSFGLVACGNNLNTTQTSKKPQTTSNAHKPVSHSQSRKSPNSQPLPGDLLIADRGNSRLLIVTPDHRIVWSMTITNNGPHNAHSLGPDDSFFTPNGKDIVVNEEDNEKLALIDIATKKIVWTYGHAGVAGSAPGYLNTPDDAYMLPNGLISVADIKNQRILFINHAGKVVKQYGTTGLLLHNPPKSFASPNGDTPTPDGGMIVTEIDGSYADRFSAKGKLMYTVHFKGITYPSDTQLLPNGNLLVADYVTPGAVEEVTPSGKVVWKYEKTSDSGELKSPSLAVPLPNGNIVLNDDANDRVVVINPHTNKIVWQYGHTGVPGTAPGYLNTPDGLDFVPANVKLPK